MAARKKAKPQLTLRLEAKLKQLGLEYQPWPFKKFNERLLPWAVIGREGGLSIIKTSGFAPRIKGKVPKEFVGCYPATIDKPALIRAVRQNAATLLGVIEAACKGDWGRFGGMRNVQIWLRTAPDVTDQDDIANRGTEVFLKVLGGKGRHTRATASVLPPKGNAVEMQVIFAARLRRQLQR
ncbi:MAG: hypothetical protein AB7G80_03395 [Dongiaceae bacterium]